MAIESMKKYQQSPSVDRRRPFTLSLPSLKMYLLNKTSETYSESEKTTKLKLILGHRLFSRVVEQWGLRTEMKLEGI
jgi:hypothetical protein